MATIQLTKVKKSHIIQCIIPIGDDNYVNSV